MHDFSVFERIAAPPSEGEMWGRVRIADGAARPAFLFY